MNMLTELRNREIADAVIVCRDGLKSLPEAIRVTWPQAMVQTSVVHLVRKQSALRLREVLGPDREKPREIYTASTVEAAEDHFQDFVHE